MAGVAFDELDRLATPATAAPGRDLLAPRLISTPAQSGRRTARIAQTRSHQRAIPRVAKGHSDRGDAADHRIAPPFMEFWHAAQSRAAAQTDLAQTLPRELDRARGALQVSARNYLPGYLVFAARELRDSCMNYLRRVRGPEQSRRRERKSARARERHLLLYLQRVCGKNDTLSELRPRRLGNSEFGGSRCHLAARSRDREARDVSRTLDRAWSRRSDQCRSCCCAPSLRRALRLTFASTATALFSRHRRDTRTRPANPRPAARLRR